MESNLSQHVESSPSTPASLAIMTEQDANQPHDGTSVPDAGVPTPDRASLAVVPPGVKATQNTASSSGCVHKKAPAKRRPGDACTPSSNKTQSAKSAKTYSYRDKEGVVFQTTTPLATVPSPVPQTNSLSVDSGAPEHRTPPRDTPLKKSPTRAATRQALIVENELETQQQEAGFRDADRELAVDAEGDRIRATTPTGLELTRREVEDLLRSETWHHLSPLPKPKDPQPSILPSTDSDFTLPMPGFELKWARKLFRGLVAATGVGCFFLLSKFLARFLRRRRNTPTLMASPCFGGEVTTNAVSYGEKLGRWYVYRFAHGQLSHSERYWKAWGFLVVSWTIWRLFKTLRLAYRVCWSIKHCLITRPALRVRHLARAAPDHNCDARCDDGTVVYGPIDVLKSLGCTAIQLFSLNFLTHFGVAIKKPYEAAISRLCRIAERDVMDASRTMIDRGLLSRQEVNYYISPNVVSGTQRLPFSLRRLLGRWKGTALLLGGVSLSAALWLSYKLSRPFNPPPPVVFSEVHPVLLPEDPNHQDDSVALVQQQIVLRGDGTIDTRNTPQQILRRFGPFGNSGVNVQPQGVTHVITNGAWYRRRAIQLAENPIRVFDTSPPPDTPWGRAHGRVAPLWEQLKARVIPSVFFEDALRSRPATLSEEYGWTVDYIKIRYCYTPYFDSRRLAARAVELKARDPEVWLYWAVYSYHGVPTHFHVMFVSHVLFNQLACSPTFNRITDYGTKHAIMLSSACNYDQVNLYSHHQLHSRNVIQDTCTLAIARLRELDESGGPLRLN